MTLKKGCYYRFRGGSTIWLVVHIWPDDDKPGEAEVMVLRGEEIESKVWSLAQLEIWLTQEVGPTWRNIGPVEPDPRQTDVEALADDLGFFANMMGDD